MAEHADAFKIRDRIERLHPSSILTPEDINKLLLASDNLRDKALVSILWESGSRIHEILAIDLGDITKTPSPETERSS